MNPKSIKIVRKFAFHLPFGILIGLTGVLIIWGIHPFYWQIGILIGVVMSLYFIIINVNDYNSINDIDVNDFLESSHSEKFLNSPDAFIKFQLLLDHQFVSHKIYKHQENKIVVKVDYSLIIITRENGDVELKVERNSFDFMPDRGKNYKMMQRIINAI